MTGNSTILQDHLADHKPPEAQTLELESIFQKYIEAVNSSEPNDTDLGRSDKP